MSLYRDRSLTTRMIRAAQLDPALYEEVERDRRATGQAGQVVLIAAVAAAIGLLLGLHIISAVLTLVTVILGWIVWSFLAYFIGTRLFATPETRTSPGEMLRTLGFSHAPGAFLVLRFIPVLGSLIALAVAVWQLVASVIAVRAALDVDTGRAIGTVIVGWLVVFLIETLLLGTILIGRL